MNEFNCHIDSLCDPPCGEGETCDEINGGCICDPALRHEEICRLRRGMVMPFKQLFRERLSEKVHGTILKDIVGGFAFTQVPQGYLGECHERQ